MLLFAFKKRYGKSLSFFLPLKIYVFIELKDLNQDQNLINPFTWFTVVVGHDAVQDPVPARRGGHLEQQDHALTKGPAQKIINIISMS